MVCKASCLAPQLLRGSGSQAAPPEPISLQRPEVRLLAGDNARTGTMHMYCWPVAKLAQFLICPAQGTSKWETGCYLGDVVVEGGYCSHGVGQGCAGLQGCKFRVKQEMLAVLYCRSLKALQTAKVGNEEKPGILWRRGKGNWGVNIVCAGTCGAAVMFGGL